MQRVVELPLPHRRDFTMAQRFWHLSDARDCLEVGANCPGQRMGHQWHYRVHDHTHDLALRSNELIRFGEAMQVRDLTRMKGAYSSGSTFVMHQKEAFITIGIREEIHRLL